MANVIGGEFAIAADKLQYATLPDDGQHRLAADAYYSSGRAALRAILSVAGDQHAILLLPSYLCSSVTQTVLDAGWRYQFYAVRHDFYPDMPDLLAKMKKTQGTAVLLINYFGLLNLEETVMEIRHHARTTVIVDDVQRLFGFAMETDFDFCFTSLRKWLSVPDGGLVKCGATHRDVKLPVYAEVLPFTSYKLAGNLLKSFSQVIPDSLCLELLRQGEGLLDEHYVGGMSSVTELLLRAMDIQKAARQRQANAAVLHRGLEQLGIRHIYQSEAVPLFVPIFLDPKRRDKVKQAFFKEKIFCPVHWPQSKAGLSGDSDFYATELSLICDQRYGAQDMERQLAVLRRCIDY